MASRSTVFGLLITRDDEAVFEEWCADQLPLYEAVVCLDGSTSGATAELAARFAERIVYLHERDCDIPCKTDHGLRRVAHNELIRRFGPGRWIMCCHADEFCYHDPGKIALLAERTGYDLVSWYSLLFYPHPDELADWPARQALPLTERHRYYHWGHVATGLPWIEDRLYRDSPNVRWDTHTHGSVRPHGITRPAPFHPSLRHFKVVATETSWCEVVGNSTCYRHHWQGLTQRTGLPYAVHEFSDLFVNSVPNYTQCDRFDGILDQPWNMGDELRRDEHFGERQLRTSPATSQGTIHGHREMPAHSPAVAAELGLPAHESASCNEPSLTRPSAVSPVPRSSEFQLQNCRLQAESGVAAFEEVCEMRIGSRLLQVSSLVRGAVDAQFSRTSGKAMCTG